MTSDPHPAAAPATGRSGPTTARQRELFGQLLAIFLAEGFADFTMDGAAARLHCSKATLYALGATSEEVVRRVLISFFQETARRTELAVAPHTSPSRALRAYFEAMGQALQPASARFMRDVATDPVARAVYDTNTRAATARIQGLIERGIAVGEFRELPVEFTSQLLALAMEHIQQGDLGQTTTSRAYQELGNLILDGIGR